MNMKRVSWPAAALMLCCALAVQAKVSPQEAERLKGDLMPLGGERAGNAAGTIPAWEGGFVGERPRGRERDPASYPLFFQDKPLYTITSSNLSQYKALLSPGHLALFAKFPDTYKMPVYQTRRSAASPPEVYEATYQNALRAELGNDGESLLNAVVGIPFPIPKSGKEIIWNHKVRYRGTSARRFNVQLAVQPNGDFQPFKLREDVRFHYSYPNQTPESLQNVIIYFLQFTMSPPRQSGNVLLVHETMDQIKEARRAWLYNPGQRRIRRAPNVAYDNPGTGADGLRTNDQLDVFNGATDRYTWKIVGKREMLVPYNSQALISDELKYRTIAGKGHLNQSLTRYELHRVWVLDTELKSGTSHLYKRRTFYVDEDSWNVLAVDIYDNRNQLWRVQEAHTAPIPWTPALITICGTVYDLQANRYLLMDLSNEEPLTEDELDWPLEHFTTGNVTRMATK